MSGKFRLQYLDWMRGLAVVLMMETHVFNSFLNERCRTSEWYWLSQFLGGMAAPMFLFVAGVSLALVLDRLHEKRTPASLRLDKVIRRGLWILLLAYAFRFEQAITWYPYAQWDQVFKVDILNCIAMSSLAVGLSSMWFQNRRTNAIAMAGAAAAIVITTPWAHLIRSGIPSRVIDYINGSGHENYFMFFSWSAFVFGGAAVGYLLLSARRRNEEERFIVRCGACGVIAFAVGYVINIYPGISYGFYDYSLTSPPFFLVRLGYMLIFLYGSYRWSTWTRSGRASPLLAFGQTSLLVYWVHIEFVYGRLRPFRNSLGIGATAAQLLWLVPLMFILARIRLGAPAAAQWQSRIT